MQIFRINVTAYFAETIFVGVFGNFHTSSIIAILYITLWCSVATEAVRRHCIDHCVVTEWPGMFVGAKRLFESSAVRTPQSVAQFTGSYSIGTQHCHTRSNIAVRIVYTIYTTGIVHHSWVTRDDVVVAIHHIDGTDHGHVFHYGCSTAPTDETATVGTLFCVYGTRINTVTIYGKSTVVYRTKTTVSVVTREC